jgi:hypothetical protein
MEKGGPGPPSMLRRLAHRSLLMHVNKQFERLIGAKQRALEKKHSVKRSRVLHHREQGHGHIGGEQSILPDPGIDAGTSFPRHH